MNITNPSEPILQPSTASIGVDCGGQECGLSPAELLLLKRRKVELLKKRAELTKNFGMLNYKPHDKQDRFHRAGDKLQRLLMAGNRFGKSHMGAAEDCAWLYGERVWYPQGDPGRTIGIPQRPVKGLVITVDWDKVDEIWTSQRGNNKGKLWQLLPADFVKSHRTNHAGVICEVVMTNGSMICFDTVKSWKQNPLGTESSDWDFIHVDEPCPEKMYSAAARGLVDRGGSTWFTLTPLTEQWIIDMFYAQKANRRDLPETYSSEFRWVCRGSMHDNPHLSTVGKELYLASLSVEERACRELGLPLELAGLVYKQFDWSRHVLSAVPQGWSSWTNPPLDYTIYIAIDPHPQTPHAVLFLAVSPLGQCFLYDEIWSHCTIKELCEMIKEKSYVGGARRNVVRIKCDPMAWINDPITGGNMEDEFAAHNVFVEKATKALMQGILHVQNELNLPNRIYVVPTLERFLFEIQRYCWDADKGKPIDKDDHMMEDFYRLMLENPVWVPRDDGSATAVPDIEITESTTNLRDLEET